MSTWHVSKLFYSYFPCPRSFFCVCHSGFKILFFTFWCFPCSGNSFLPLWFRPPFIFIYTHLHECQGCKSTFSLNRVQSQYSTHHLITQSSSFGWGYEFCISYAYLFPLWQWCLWTGHLYRGVMYHPYSFMS